LLTQDFQHFSALPKHMFYANIDVHLMSRKTDVNPKIDQMMRSSTKPARDWFFILNRWEYAVEKLQQRDA